MHVLQRKRPYENNEHCVLLERFSGCDARLRLVQWLNVAT